MKSLKTDPSGASLVEYVLLLALIFLVAIVAVQSFQGSVSSQFSHISSTLGYHIGNGP